MMNGKAKSSLFALGRLKVGVRNKTEKAYEEMLIAQEFTGEILWHKFEGMKFRLADNTFYTPDFAVMRADGQIELHEVKGYMLEDANVKIKIASSIFPFKFFIVRAKAKKDGGGFSIQEV